MFLLSHLSVLISFYPSAWLPSPPSPEDLWRKEEQTCDLFWPFLTFWQCWMDDINWEIYPRVILKIIMMHFLCWLDVLFPLSLSPKLLCDKILFFFLKEKIYWFEQGEWFEKNFALLFVLVLNIRRIVISKKHGHFYFVCIIVFCLKNCWWSQLVFFVVQHYFLRNIFKENLVFYCFLCRFLVWDKKNYRWSRAQWNCAHFPYYLFLCCRESFSIVWKSFLVGFLGSSPSCSLHIFSGLMVFFLSTFFLVLLLVLLFRRFFFFKNKEMNQFVFFL